MGRNLGDPKFGDGIGLARGVGKEEKVPFLIQAGFAFGGDDRAVGKSHVIAGGATGADESN
ncbi:MAG: hypothetical protein JWQ04_460 [Pedosphaera sp.]|nr:hypothetical protein [Pedosphaera sp.]